MVLTAGVALALVGVGLLGAGYWIDREWFQRVRSGDLANNAMRWDGLTAKVAGRRLRVAGAASLTLGLVLGVLAALT